LITAEKLIEISSYLTLIHQTKGRIRVRVSSKIKEQSENITLADIEDIANKIDGIKRVKINKIIGSITIEYNNSIFPDNLWRDLLEQQNLDEIVKIINDLSKKVV
jgi:hypothetical protein